MLHKSRTEGIGDLLWMVICQVEFQVGWGREWAGGGGRRFAIPTMPFCLGMFVVHMSKPTGVCVRTTKWRRTVVKDAEERLKVVYQVVPINRVSLVSKAHGMLTSTPVVH